MHAPARVGDDRRAEFQQLRLLMLGLLVVTLPLVAGRVVWWSPGGVADYNRRVTLAPFDVPLAMLVFAAVADRRQQLSWRSWPVAAKVAAVLGAVLLVALVAHPSPRGFEFALRVAALLAVADALIRLDERARRLLLALLVGVGSFEALIGLAQAAHGGELGLGPLEVGGYFYRFGTSTAARAGLSHPYHLAAFLLVAVAGALVGVRGNARQQAPWLIGAGICTAAIATTYSRAALLSVGGMVLFALIGPRDVDRQTAVRTMAVVITVGFAIGAVAFGNGWWARSESTFGPNANADSYRSEFAKEAVRLARTSPVVGVGPGRYVIALETVDHQEGVLLPAHDVFLHEAAEGGVIAGVLTAVLFVAMLIRYARGGALAMAVFCALAFYFLFDAYPYTFPTGLAITGIWLGLLEVARQRPRQREAVA